MKRILWSIALLFFCLFLFGFHQARAANKVEYFEAKVQKVEQKENEKQVKVVVTSSSQKGREYTISLITEKNKDWPVRIGDRLLISYEKLDSGKEQVFIVDFVRKKELLLLFFLFLVLVFAIGRWKGISSFIGMFFSFFVIAGFILPNIVLGNDPVLISLFGALFIIPVTFYLAHGVNKKTTIALVSTFLSLILTGVLAYIFVGFTRITGLAAEETAFLQMIEGAALNVKNLLLAGIIIGAMGILDDITISQTAIVERLIIANPKYSFKELYFHAMEVGKDHIASLVNTLILVYTGASLPLFLLFSHAQMSYTNAINQEVIATEIVRTLVSSIGIVAAVPITTVIAASYLKKNKIHI